jgi:SpoIID/LytB domain protein
MAAPLAATAAAATPGWALHGSGWGHGIGMSQYGAMEMARDGYKAPQILAHYYTGTTYNAVRDDMWVNVNIVYGASSVSAKSSALLSGGGSFQVTAGSTVMNGQNGDVVQFSRSGGLVTATCGGCTTRTSLSGSALVLNWDHPPVAPSRTTDRTLMMIGGTQYRDGAAVITPRAAGGLNVVNQVTVHDEYLDYIAESPWSWSVEALKAQAAAARGYVLAKYQALGGNVQSKCNCHVFDTTVDQVYGGYSTVQSNGNALYWKNWKNAVHATGASNTTTGYVAKYGANIIQAFFSSSSGGRTENNEDVWGGTPLPYLRGVADPWSLRSSNPNAHWKQTTSGPSMAGVFGLSDVARLDLRNRTANGGVKYATATSSSGAQRTIRGDSLRAIVASPGGAVKSTMIRHLTGRLSGADRYASAAAVARRISTSASAVVIAGGDTTLSDASVAGPLAATVAGPLLLTQRGKLPAATVTELNRRGSAVRTAYIVGGTGVVSDAVAQQLRSRGLAVTRLGGRDRYATSALVARAIKSKRSTPTVVVAGGNGLADALGASGPASALREPILLTQVDRLTPVTRDAIKAVGATQSRIVGGTAVVGTAVQNELAAMGARPIRLAGANRYESSGAVAQFYRRYLPNTSEAVLTSGADTALVDSLVAGTLQRLVVLTKKSSLVEPAARTLQSTPALETVTAVGGTGALANSALTAAANS